MKTETDYREENAELRHALWQMQERCTGLVYLIAAGTIAGVFFGFWINRLFP